MKDCWKILGIERTEDTIQIKKAFRLLIKKYHPDTATNPEMERKFTIKTVELVEAYRAAEEYAKAILAGGIRYPSTSTTATTYDSPLSSPLSKKKSLWEYLGACLIGLFGLVCYAAIFCPSFVFDTFYNALHSLSSNNPFRILIESGLLIYCGYVLSAILWITATSWYFGISLLIAKFLPEAIEPYIWKLGYVFALLCALVMYNLLSFDNELLKISICCAMPVALLFDWIKDYILCRRIKKKYPSMFQLLNENGANIGNLGVLD